MKKEKRVHEALISIICDVELRNLIDIKNLLRIDTYDATVVILYVTARSFSGNGVTESEMSEALGMSRPTLNRIVKRLTDQGLLEIHGTGRPRRVVRRLKFNEAALMEREASKEMAAHIHRITQRQSNGLAQALKLLLSAQYERSDD